MDRNMFAFHDSQSFINDFHSEELSWSKKEIEDECKRQKAFDASCKRAIVKAKKRRRRQEVREIRRKFGPLRNAREFDLSTTTKRIMAFLFINFTIVEIYSMIVMLIVRDLSSLATLLGSVISETISFSVYCTKSYFETKAEKANELELKKMDTDNIINEDAVEDVS